MRIGSLFSGIGGLDLGVERATGGKVAWHCEADPFCRSVLARHWPGVPCYEDVVGLVPPPADMLIGGFPCQDISSAGKQEGIDGKKSGLWAEYARIIGLLRPRFVFIENVADLAVRGLTQVVADLAALGFDAEWDTLGACCVGAPHRRERLFVLATRNTDGEGEPVCTFNDEAPRVSGLGYTEGERLEREGVPRPITQSDWWDAEPDVGSLAHGLSDWLARYGGLDEGESARSGEILSQLWSPSLAQALREAAGRCGSVPTADALQSFLWQQQGEGRIPRQLLEGPQASERIVRILRELRHVDGSSHERKAERQRSGKHTNALRELSLVVAPRGSPPWAHPGWEGGASRTGIGVPNRVAQLRALGNAVVPAQAEAAFRILAARFD